MLISQIYLLLVQRIEHWISQFKEYISNFAVQFFHGSAARNFQSG